jgi:hypothetical protein
MSPHITQYLNKTVLVSIPVLFDDAFCRPFTLLGTELDGLWLQSDELSRRLLPNGRRDAASLRPAVFVPLAQIAGVLITADPAAAKTPQETSESHPRSDQTRGRQGRRRRAETANKTR